MKTIAVLTDFSTASEHAAKYAAHLAQKIKANILLYATSMVPVEVAAGPQSPWPDETDIHALTDTECRLADMAARLHDELKERTFPGTFLPMIDFRAEPGLTAIPAFGPEEHIGLLVQAADSDEYTGRGIANSWLGVSGSADIPVLIIPEHAPIRNVEKFAFATDTSYSDIANINALAGLAKFSTAEILVADVTQNNFLDNERETAIKRFKEGIITDVDYSRVYYRIVPNTNIKNGLQWLVENIRFDMLAIVRRKCDNVDSVFNLDRVQSMAVQTSVPLLIYPYRAES
jgi:hypothetical protein